jgi:Tfp pilus assembly protein PilN
MFTLNGTTTDLAELHIYLATLEQQKLFSEVDLISIETHSANEAAGSRFTVQIVLKPGHGQPGGPKTKAADLPLERTAGI